LRITYENDVDDGIARVQLHFRCGSDKSPMVGGVESPTVSNAARTPKRTGRTTRIGRPPRIDRAAIARAVIDLGFDEATMKSTAEKLGVSVPGLYHYVSGRDELVRLAAEYQLASHVLPTYHGQDWEAWLREWATYTYKAMSDQPEVLDLYVSDSIDDSRVLDTIAYCLARLVDLGYTLDLGFRAWQAVSTVAMGSAVASIHNRAEAGGDRPWLAKLAIAGARAEGTEREVLEALTKRAPGGNADTSFERNLDLMIEALRPAFEAQIPAS